MFKIPQVKIVMTPFPRSIESTQSAAEARDLMEAHDIRHLPVTKARQLVGMLSERDLRGEDDDMPVWSLCTPDPYRVQLEAPLDEVVLQMAERAIGSAVVLKDDRIAGVFTATDGLRYLGTLLRELRGDDPEARAQSKA